MSIFYGYNKVAGGEDLVKVDQILSVGTKIATINVDDITTDLYAPSPSIDLSGITKIIAGSNIVVSPEENLTTVTISAIIPETIIPSFFYINEDSMQVKVHERTAFSGLNTKADSPWEYSTTEVTSNALYRTDEITTEHDSFVNMNMNIDITDADKNNPYVTAILIYIKSTNSWKTVSYGTSSCRGAGACANMPLKAGTKIRGFIFTQDASIYVTGTAKPGSTGLVVTEFYRG